MMKYIKTKNEKDVVCAIMSQIVPSFGMTYSVLNGETKVEIDFSKFNEEEVKERSMQACNEIVELLNSRKQVKIDFYNHMKIKIKKVQDYYYIDNARRVLNNIIFEMLNYVKDFKFDILYGNVNLYHKYYIFEEKYPTDMFLPCNQDNAELQKYYEKCDEISESIIKEIEKYKDYHPKFILKNNKVKFEFLILSDSQEK